MAEAVAVMRRYVPKGARSWNRSVPAMQVSKNETELAVEGQARVLGPRAAREPE